MKRWSNIDKNPIGTILEIIGTCGEFKNESLVCLKRAHIQHCTDEVPKDVNDHLTKLISDMKNNSIEDYIPRIDLTNSLIFTIDPEGSRDLDDALSIEWVESQQRFKVGVHIADVAHFIRPNDPIDKYAQERLTTV